MNYLHGNEIVLSNTLSRPRRSKSKPQGLPNFGALNLTLFWASCSGVVLECRQRHRKPANCSNNKPLDQWIARPTNHSTSKFLNQQTAGPVDRSTSKPFGQQNARRIGCSTSVPLDQQVAQPANHSTGGCSTSEPLD